MITMAVDGNGDQAAPHGASNAVSQPAVSTPPSPPAASPLSSDGELAAALQHAIDVHGIEEVLRRIMRLCAAAVPEPTPPMSQEDEL